MDLKHITSVIQPNSTKEVTSKLLVDDFGDLAIAHRLREFIVGERPLYFSGDIYYVPLDSEGKPTQSMEKFWFTTARFYSDLNNGEQK